MNPRLIATILAGACLPTLGGFMLVNYTTYRQVGVILMILGLILAVIVPGLLSARIAGTRKKQNEKNFEIASSISSSIPTSSVIELLDGGPSEPQMLTQRKRILPGQYLTAKKSLKSAITPSRVEEILEPPPTPEEYHDALLNPWPGHSPEETIFRNRSRDK